MKILKIDEGVRKVGSKYVFDMSNDDVNDLINTSISEELYFHLFDDNSYYFGYKFKDNISRNQRSDFLKWLKNQDSLTSELESFIIRPIKTLKKEFDFNEFGLIIYPKSERSKLTNLIINSISNIVGRNVGKKSVEVLKQLPNNELISQINSGNILIVDDVNTSGSTLREIIRIIREINKDCNIFIYTLIGK